MSLRGDGGCEQPAALAVLEDCHGQRPLEPRVLVGLL